MKICVIGVYFGKLPNYFSAWLKSCEYNKNIDFYLVSDSSEENFPPNVHLIHMKLEDMKELAEYKLGMKIVLDTPYKCCDYKPVYGIIFEDYVKEYDYWGHCDLDMVFGDLNYFFEKYHLSEYDKFLPLGHLAFYRNTKECNERYKIIPQKGNSYIESFSVSNTTQFDELGGINAIYNENEFPFFKKRVFADLSFRWKRIKLAEKYIDSDDKNYPYQLFFWDRGKAGRCYIKNGRVLFEPFMYIHIKKRKIQDFDFDIDGINAFYILSDRLLPKEENCTIDKALIRKLNPYKGSIYEWLEYYYFSRFRGRIGQKG